MTEYRYPGVYIEEIGTGVRTIEGVSTSTAGFVGQTERGPISPTLVTSFSEYQRWYGGFIDPGISYLPFAVRGFFDNGGQRLFVARVVGAGATRASLTLGSGTNLKVEAIGPGEWGERIFVRVQTGAPGSAGGSIGFRLTVIYYCEMPPLPVVDPLDPANRQNPDYRQPAVIEDYRDLSIEPQTSGYVIDVVNKNSRLIKVAAPAAPAALPAAVSFAALSGGIAGNPVAADYIGDRMLPENQRIGLAALELVGEISVVAVPDEAAFPEVTAAMIDQCARRQDRFAVTDVPKGQRDVSAIHPPQDSSWAAVYYPWIRVPFPGTENGVLVPPVGHVAGVYARTDNNYGVHKAPANEVIEGVVTEDVDGSQAPLEFTITQQQQDVLNPRGINVIRDFRAEGRGIRVWGARTISSDQDWKYVNVRRLFIFIEHSIDQGTQWVVFEPNDEKTWACVRRTIENFLTAQWRKGTLLGSKQEEAFFVKCDRTTMTQDDLDNGRLICLIGVAPVKPAEFVIFRIGQWTAEAHL